MGGLISTYFQHKKDEVNCEKKTRQDEELKVFGAGNRTPLEPVKVYHSRLIVKIRLLNGNF